MNVLELQNFKIEGGAYYLTGNDAYWLDYAQTHFKNVLDKNSLGLVIIDKLFDINDIWSSVLKINFSGDINVILVRDEQFKADDKAHKNLAKLLNYAIAPNILVFCNVNFLTPAEKSKMTEIKCEKLRKYDCMRFAERFFTNGIEPRAMDMLAEYANCDMARIKIEGEKLSCFGNNEKITLSMVETLVAEDTDLQIYEFASNFLIGKRALAVKQLDKLKKRGENFSVLLTAITNQFRRMLYAGLSKLSDKELADIFKIKEYAVTKTRENKSFGKMKLKTVVEMLDGYEYRFKSGEMSDQTALNSAMTQLLAM